MQTRKPLKAWQKLVCLAIVAIGCFAFYQTTINVMQLNHIRFATAATLQADINAVCNGTVPCTVYLPVGSSTNVAAFTLPGNSTLSCPIRRGCAITASNNYGTNFILATGANITIDGLIIDCNKGTQSGSGICVRATNVTNFHLSASIVQNSKANAVFVDGTSNSGVWIEDNLVQHTTGGNGILVGNTPASQGGADAAASNVHIKHNEIHDINGTADGIFTIGEIASTGYGITGCEISGNIIDTFPDTAIEVGEGSLGCTVVDNKIDVPASLNGGVGISTRSASNITVSGNTVTCHNPIVVQDGIFAWHCTGGACGGGVSDPPAEQFINIASNTVTGCATGGGNDYQANSGDNINLSSNKSSNVAASYLYGGTNVSHCGNDDNTCGGNNGNDYFLDPGSGHVIHLERAIGINPAGGSFTPTAGASLHIQEGGNANAFTIQATSNANTGMNVQNTTQSWSHDIRAASGGLVSCNESWVIRDITGSTDIESFCPTSGNIQMLGKFTTYNNLSLADLGLPIVVGTPQHVTGQTANIGATNIFASAPVGTYEAHVGCRTTTSGTGTTATFSVIWTDEGGTKTFTSPTWALNSVTVSGQINQIFPLHATASSNIQYSVTGTFGTSVYACDAWVTRTQ